MEAKAIGESAFDIIYEENAEYVYRTAFYYCDNHHVAEDITQTVFMIFFISMPDIKKEKARSWLCVSAKHMAMNYKRGMEREILLGEILYNREEECERSPSMEDIYIERLDTEKYRFLLEDIFVELYHHNPRWYAAITITYLLGKPQKEVADIMNVKIEVLQSMLYRAKKWIKKKYEKQLYHLDKE